MPPLSAQLPESIEAAVSQSVIAAAKAIAAGHRRLQIELAFPELKPMGISQQFLAESAEWGDAMLGETIKVFFSNAGAAALAQRDWEGAPYILKGIEELLTPVQPEDSAFVLIAPSAVEVSLAENIANQAGDRPYILLNPELQDISVVGIGYAGRQLRERFLSTIEPCYYISPLKGGILYRAFPDPWQIWWETDSGDYQLLESLDNRPDGEELDRVLARVLAPEVAQGGILKSLQSFLKSLSQ